MYFALVINQSKLFVKSIFASFLKKKKKINVSKLSKLSGKLHFTRVYLSSYTIIKRYIRKKEKIYLPYCLVLMY